MIVRIAHLAIPAVLASSVLLACSSKAPPSDAYVNASLNGGGNCNISADETLFVIGSDSSEAGISLNPTRVANGATDNGTVQIACSVKGGSSGYSIELSALLNTAEMGAGGSLTLEGTVDPSTGAQGTIAATIVSAGNTYEESDCSISYPVNPSGGPVAPGRIWGEVDCPNATLSGKTNTNTGMPVTCDISALFVFENCAS